jgi:hypothetical protein
MRSSLPSSPFARVARLGGPAALVDVDSDALEILHDPPPIEIGGLHYVTLTSGGDLLAVFRVRNDGKLKRLVRPPPKQLKRETS